MTACVDYVSTPENRVLILRAHALVREEPGLFRGAGRRLDERYSPAALAERFRPPVPESRLSNAPHIATREERLRAAEESGDARAVISLSLPTADDYALPSLRFAVLLRDIFRDAEPSSLPARIPDPEWSALVILVLWLLTDEHAGQCEQATRFQQWPWDGPDATARCMMQFWVQDWPRLLKAAEDALVELDPKTRVVRSDDVSWIRRRDELLHEIRPFVERHLVQLRAAASRVLQPMRDGRAARQAELKVDAREAPTLMDIARDIARDRDRMMAPGDIEYDPAHPPDGFTALTFRVEGSRLPVWVQRVIEATGRFDDSLASRVPNWADCIDHEVNSDLDLAKVSGLDALAHWRSRLASRRMSLDEARRDLLSQYEIPEAGEEFIVEIQFEELVERLVSRGLHAQRRREEWYEVLVCILPYIDPDLDLASVGLPSGVRYKASDRAPADLLEDVPGHESPLWALAERALGHLGDDDARHSPDFPRLSPTDEEILLVLLASDERLMTKVIASRMDRDPKSIGKNLSALGGRGLIENPGRQGYALKPKGRREAQRIRADRSVAR